MYTILVRLLVMAALLDLGISLAKIDKCDSRLCLMEVQKASLKVLKIEWKPIRVFPDKELSRRARSGG